MSSLVNYECFKLDFIIKKGNLRKEKMKTCHVGDLLGSLIITPKMQLLLNFKIY